jgi:hypothetical protein
MLGCPHGPISSSQTSPLPSGTRQLVPRPSICMDGVERKLRSRKVRNLFKIYFSYFGGLYNSVACACISGSLACSFFFLSYVCRYTLRVVPQYSAGFTMAMATATQRILPTDGLTEENGKSPIHSNLLIFCESNKTRQRANQFHLSVHFWCYRSASRTRDVFLIYEEREEPSIDESVEKAAQR